MKKTEAMTKRVTNESSIATRDWTMCRKSVASSAAAALAPTVAAVPVTCPTSSLRTSRYSRATPRMPATAEAIRHPNSS